MKNLQLSILMLFVAFNFSNAQELISGQVGGTRNAGLISTTPIVLNSNVEGSPYVDENFKPARISASEDNIFYARYNAMSDQFEVRGENNVAYALNKYRRDIMVEFVAPKKAYQVFGYMDEDDNENFGYFVILNNPDSRVKFLKRERVYFVNEKVAVTSYDTPKPATYKRANDDYYLKVGDNPAVLTSPKKKEIVELFPKKKEKILDFIKDEKLKLKKEKDFNKLIDFINQLG